MIKPLTMRSAKKPLPERRAGSFARLFHAFDLAFELTDLSFSFQKTGDQVGFTLTGFEGFGPSGLFHLGEKLAEDLGKG